MAWLLFILILLASYHFVVENMVFPVFREQLKHKFLHLSDRLYSLECSREGRKIPEPIFKLLDSSISYTITYMNEFNLLNLLLTIRKLKRHRDLTNAAVKAEHQITVVEHSEELDHIFNSYMSNVSRLFIINSAACMIYIFPFLFLAQLCIFIWKLIEPQTSLLSSRIRHLAFVLFVKKQVEESSYYHHDNGVGFFNHTTSSITAN